MTTTTVPQPPEAGALSNVIDLAAEREIRRPVDPLERCAELSKQVWRSLEAAGYSRPNADGSQPENPLIRQLGARAKLKRMLNPPPAQPDVVDFRANSLLPDLSSLSFEDCAAVVKSMARIPFSDVDEVLHYATYTLLEHVWTRLLDLDPKRGERVINSAMKTAKRKRLLRNQVGGRDAA
jgi:hypothetical protein